MTDETKTTKRERQIPKHDIDTLMLCIAGAWLHGTISGGRARELARSIGRTANQLEQLKFAEERENEARADLSRKLGVRLIKGTSGIVSGYSYRDKTNV